MTISLLYIFFSAQVQAVDSGKPFGRTADAPLTVFVDDINDKKPEFEHVRNPFYLPQKLKNITISFLKISNFQSSYAGYVLESAPVGSPVLRVSAVDPDRTGRVEYRIAEPITARDKTGNEINNRVSTKN